MNDNYKHTHTVYYITQETPPYISFPYLVRYTWRLCEVTCRTFIFVLIWLTLGGYLLSAIVTIEALLIAYLAQKEKKYDFLSYFVAIPLAYLRQKRTWTFTFVRLIEHCIMLSIIWLCVFFDFDCEQTFGCAPHYKIRRRLWPNDNISFGFVLLSSTTVMTFLTPLLYFIIWHKYIIKDISRLMATQERDIWIIVKTGDLRGLTEMIEFGVNPDLRNAQNKTLLHVYFESYISYNQEFVNVLSTHPKFYMGAKSEKRQTILHSSVSHSMPSREAIKYLLSFHRHIISVNDTDCNGKTPLMYYLNPSSDDRFMRDANSKLLRLMSDTKYGLRAETRDNIGNCIIHYACKNPMISDNNIEFVIDLYLKAVNKIYGDGVGDDESKETEEDDDRSEIVMTDKEHIEQYNRKRANKSIHSASHQWEYVVGSVDVKNRFHQTPFMFYMRYNSMISNAMINLFMEHQMDPLVRDGFKNSVFHWAVANPSINQQFGCDALRFMCQHMEKYGSLMDAFAANAKEESIFHTYFLENTQFNEDIIRLLLDYRVDINTVDLKGNTALHYAMSNECVNEKYLLFLLSKDGGDTILHIDVKNVENKTPIDLYKSCHSALQFQSFVNAVSMHNYLKHKVNINRNNSANPITLKDEL